MLGDLREREGGKMGGQGKGEGKGVGRKAERERVYDYSMAQ